MDKELPDYTIGYSNGQKNGYNKALEDVKKIIEEQRKYFKDETLIDLFLTKIKGMKE